MEGDFIFYTGGLLMDTVEKVIFEYHLALSQKENQKRIKQYQKEDPLMMAYFVLCAALYMYLLKWSPFSTKVNLILIAVIVISLFAFLFFFLGRIGTRKWKTKVAYNMHAIFCIKKEVLLSILKQKNFSPQLFYNKLQRKELRRTPFQNVLAIVVSILSLATSFLALLTNNVDFSISTIADYIIHIFLMVMLIIYTGMMTYAVYINKAYFEYPSMRIFEKKQVHKILKLLEDDLKY